MIRILEKLFCKHTWKRHAKHIYKWTQIEIVAGTAHWYRTKYQTKEYQETVEILICEKCGKVHKITY